MDDQHEIKTNTTSFVKNKLIFRLAFILFILLTIGLVGYKIYRQFSSQKHAGTKKTIIKQVIVKRSKTLGIIMKATTAKAIDVKTGKVIQAARIFSFDDKTIYLALDLDSAKSGTYIDYVRYLNGRYVDHGNVKITRDATNNISFNWTNIKPLGSIGDGQWKIATYTNGILEKQVSYSVKKNIVSWTDSDYDLSHTML